MTTTDEGSGVTTTLQLTLADISRLTGVQRPVVSTWRRRAAATDAPFPAPVARVAGQERFDGDAVVRWLESTGRGTPDLAADAPAHALPVAMSLRDDPALVDGLTALLCLAVVTGDSLGGADEPELLERARVVDPEDALLLRELDALGSRLLVLASYADQLADAAYGPAEAFERLLADRYRHAVTDSVVANLAPPAHELVSALAVSLARSCGSEPPVYVDPAGSGSDLLVSVVRADAEQSPTAAVLLADNAVSRLARRRLRVHDVPVQALPTAIDELGPAVAIAQYPPVGRPDMSATDILDSIDELALGMGQQQRAVVVAPASVLVDRLRDRELDTARADVVRTGRVRAVLRLPSGLVTHRSRQTLGVWVLGPSLDQVPVADRWTAVTDTSDQPLTTALVQQLREDAVAATAAPHLAKAHSYAQARLVPLSAVLARRGSLVPPRAAASPAGDSAALVVLVQQLRRDERTPADALGGVEVIVGESSSPPAVPVGEALRRRLLRMVPGNRAGFNLVHAGTVPVIGVPELVGTSAEARRVDRLAFLGGDASARLTESGDVVFCTSPRPRAVVDTVGGSAVQYPARVLRIHPVKGEGLSPHVLAHSLNTQPEPSRAWRAWPVPRLAADQVPTTDAALVALECEKAAVRTRLAELDSLHDALVTGTTSGALTLTTAPPHERNPH